MFWLFLQAMAGRILYLALHLESGSFPRPLSPAAQREAFAALAAGDLRARDRIIRHNLRLVAHIAKKYYASGQEPDDLVSVGTIGLIKAVARYDPARCARFSTYASRCIENATLSQMRFRARKRVPRANSPLLTNHICKRTRDRHFKNILNREKQVFKPYRVCSPAFVSAVLITAFSSRTFWSCGQFSF